MNGVQRLQRVPVVPRLLLNQFFSANARALSGTIFFLLGKAIRCKVQPLLPETDNC